MKKTDSERGRGKERDRENALKQHPSLINIMHFIFGEIALNSHMKFHISPFIINIFQLVQKKTDR